MPLIISTPPPNINYNIEVSHEHIYGGMFFNGLSRIRIQVEADSYQSSDIAKVSVSIDNTQCGQGAKAIRVKLYRHISAISSAGKKYDSKLRLTK